MVVAASANGKRLQTRIGTFQFLTETRISIQGRLPCTISASDFTQPWSNLQRGTPMIMRQCLLFRRPVWALVTLGLLTLFSLEGRTADQASPREQQIADLEKELQALTRKLNELRSVSTPTPTSTLSEGTLPADWAKSLTWRCIG